jgi:predicted molibdopterin-dependent oxidoreductase YjgC
MVMISRLNVTIDGKTVEVDKGKTILQAANSIGIRIPTLCHDPRLEPFAACRVCMVEMERGKSTALITSCNTEVVDGMVIKTDSEKVLKRRKMVLDLILSDHPKDCMTCEKCGSCKLQNLAYEYGVRESQFFKEPDGGIEEDRNPVIQKDTSKCILCGRCVRICAEVQQDYAIDFRNRGFKTETGTPFGRSLLDTTCVLCGQCVSTCPVGSLVEKSAVGKAREWELKQVKTTCGYCGVGCTLYLNVKGNQVTKVTSKVGTIPNDGNLCVKGRFGYDFVHHPDRLKKPLIKRNGQFEEATWDEALGLVAQKLKEIKAKYGPDDIGVLSSSRCTNEDNFLAQKFARAVIGTNNIDQCART